MLVDQYPRAELGSQRLPLMDPIGEHLAVLQLDRLSRQADGSFDIGFQRVAGVAEHDHLPAMRASAA